MDTSTPITRPHEGEADKDGTCLNCGADLIDDYCHACGQRAHDPRRLVIGLVQDVIVDTMSVDSKLARTLSMLFLRPASLARDYVDGRRVRYTAPFRLYLFSSLLFFLLLWTVVPFDDIEGAIGNGGGEAEQSELAEEDGLQPTPVPDEAGAASDAVAGEGRDGARIGVFDADEAENAAGVVIEPPSGLDCELAADAPRTIGERLCVGTDRVFLRMQDAAERVEEDPSLFFVQIRSNVPRVMLLAPVIYAAIMALLYIYRRRILIYDHLVVSLYMHAALYAYLSFMMLGARIPLVGDLAPLILIWGWIQAFLVHRRAYGSGWISSVLKFSAVNVVYYVSITVLLALGLGLALYQS